MIRTVKHRLRLIPKAFNGMPTYNPYNGTRFLDYRKPVELLNGYIDPNSWDKLTVAQKSQLDISDGMSEELIRNAINDSNSKLTLKTATWANTMQYVGAAADMISNALPDRDEYEGRYGNLSQGIDKGWSAASDVVSLLGPAGMVVGGFMKGASALNKGLNALGLSTDGLSKTDAVLSSDLLGWTPIGIINSAGAKESDTITKDTLAFARAGNSYTGTSARVDDAESREGKYGLFSHNALNRANKIIGEAKEQLSKVLDITNKARRRTLILSSMSQSNSMARNTRLRGGYNQSTVRAGKEGMSINKKRIDNIVKMADGSKSRFFNEFIINDPTEIKKGTRIKNPFNKLYKANYSNKSIYPSYDYEYNLESNPYGYDKLRDEWINYMITNGVLDDYLPEYIASSYKIKADDVSEKDNDIKATTTTIKQSGGTIDKTKRDPNGNYSEEEIDEALNIARDMIDSTPFGILPRFILRMMQDPTYVEWEENGKKYRGSHLMASRNEYVYPCILEINGELVKLDDEEAWRMALETGNYLKFDNERLADIFASEHYKELFPRYMSLLPVNVYDDMMTFLGNPDLTKVRIIREYDPNAQARTEGNRIYYNANSDVDELLVHEITHYLYDNGLINADVYKDYLPLNDEDLARLGATMDFVKRTGDINDFYSPSELLARLNAAKWMSGDNDHGWDNAFFILARKTPDKYGDNFRDLLMMYDDENLEKLFNLVELPKFLHGGTMNVIPDGALHRERHGMEKMEGLEDVTRKGIPVVSEEEGGEIVQQAEIERSELIFRLEVTEKLEELYKTYYDENSSVELKDAAAIEAGKILAVEIMHNTDDKTNNII